MVLALLFLVSVMANRLIVKSSLFTCGVTSSFVEFSCLLPPFPTPRITQVRCSRYAPEFRDPLIDKEYYRKLVAELTEEEKYEQELKKTQIFKAAAATETTSVFADPVIR